MALHHHTKAQRKVIRKARKGKGKKGGIGKVVGLNLRPSVATKVPGG